MKAAVQAPKSVTKAANNDNPLLARFGLVSELSAWVGFDVIAENLPQSFKSGDLGKQSLSDYLRTPTSAVILVPFGYKYAQDLPGGLPWSIPKTSAVGNEVSGSSPRSTGRHRSACRGECMCEIVCERPNLSRQRFPPETSPLPTPAIPDPNPPNSPPDFQNVGPEIFLQLQPFY